MSERTFGGFEEYAKTDAGRKALGLDEPLEDDAPVEDAPPAEPDAPPEPPAAADDAPPVPVEETPEPTSRWKRKLVVNGQEEEFEISERAVTDPDSEEGKALTAQLQKARDYDRPGGALDKAATRRAYDMQMANMADLGMATRGPDGNWTPTAKWHEWQAFQQGQQQSAPRAAAAAADAGPASPEDQSLEQLFDAAKTSGDADDWRRYTDAKAELSATRRVNEAIESQTRKRVADQQAASMGRQIADAIEGALTPFEADFRDPAVKETSEHIRQRCKDAALDKIIATNDIAAGAAAARALANQEFRLLRERNAALSSTTRKPAAAPTFRSGTAPKSGAPKRPAVDLNNPFDRRDYAAWAKTQDFGQ